MGKRSSIAQSSDLDSHLGVTDWKSAHGIWTNIKSMVCRRPDAYVSVYLTAEHQGLTSGSYEPVILDGETKDAAGLHDTGTGLTTVPAAGIYSIKASARVYNTGVAAKKFGIGIMVNGAVVHAGAYSDGVLLNGLAAALPVAADIELAAGDTVGIGIYCDSTNAAQRIVGGASVTWMTVCMIR